MTRKNIRIIVLGDENVGKSSLIHTIYSEVNSNVEKTLKKVILPPEMCLYSKDVFTELVDTSVEMDISAEMRVSDLILLVYDVSDPDTIYRIDTDWLPRIAAINPKMPVILVGNKIDKKELEYEGEHQYIKIKDILRQSNRRFKNVQMGIQCSAFYDRNVKSVLNCAQRAVLYPLSPLYSLQEKKITQQFRKAIVRIFRILDKDLDGRLHDSQLNWLQERVFQSELNLEDIKAIKEVIVRELEVEQNDYIELKGFIALQKKVIQMLKIQICWSILRHFNYTDQLRIKVNLHHFEVDQKAGQSVELSSQALNFLIHTYFSCKKHTSLNRDPSHQMSNKELIEEIFYPCPEIRFQMFLDENCVASQQKFLTAWSMYAFMNYKKCYEDLLYLGFEQSPDEAFSRRKTKKCYTDFQRLKDNKVYSILMVQSNNHQAYLYPLFSDSKRIKYGDTQCYYQRTAYIFSNQATSKTMLLFKVKKQDLPTLFDSKYDVETCFSRRIDLVVEFEDGLDQANQTRNLIPDFMLYRKICKPEAETILKVNQPPKLNLHSIPITYDVTAYTPLFTQIILKAMQNIEEGLSTQKIYELKQESKQKKNMILLSAVSFLVTGLVIGGIVSKKYQLKLWK